MTRRRWAVRSVIVAFAFATSCTTPSQTTLAVPDAIRAHLGHPRAAVFCATVTNIERQRRNMLPQESLTLLVRSVAWIGSNFTQRVRRREAFATHLRQSHGGRWNTLHPYMADRIGGFAMPDVSIDSSRRLERKEIPSVGTELHAIRPWRLKAFGQSFRHSLDDLSLGQDYWMSVTLEGDHTGRTPHIAIVARIESSKRAR